jgi:hypothetical protein
MEPDNIKLVQEDIQYQVDTGFSQIMLWSDVQKLRPSNLKISPLAVVPQKDRRGRLILDLSFPVYPERTRANSQPQLLQQGVNDRTIRLAPDAPVREIGNVFRRVLSLLNDSEADEVVMLSKVDLSDGFWRMLVQKTSIWNFAYIMPDPQGHPTRIVIPSALQMGWAESPSCYCAAAETGRDVIQELITNKIQLPPHCLKHYMHPAKSAKRSKSDSPAHGIYVYVDGFIGAAVENESGTLLGHITRAALHSIHSVFPPTTSVTGHTGGKDPISLKSSSVGMLNGTRPMK